MLINQRCLSLPFPTRRRITREGVDTGFTLLEVMLAMVLLSLSAIAVVASIPNRPTEAAKKQAESFYYRLRLLNEEAILSGRDFAIYVINQNSQLARPNGNSVSEKKRSYLYLRLTSKGWEPLNDKKYSKIELEEEIAIDLKLGGTSWGIDASLFDKDPLLQTEINSGETSYSGSSDIATHFEQKFSPQIYVLSSGEITPFHLDFSTRHDSDDSWRVKVSESGNIQLLQPESLSSDHTMINQAPLYHLASIEGLLYPYGSKRGKLLLGVAR